MRRVSFALLMLVLVAHAAEAQRRPRVFTSDPDSWVSVGIAGLTGSGVNDGRTATTWDFGSSMNWQYSASVEKTVGSGTSLGIAGTYARIPFVYSGPSLPVIPGSGGTCSPRCDAHLNMSTLVATLHIGAGTGLHQVIEVGAGIVNYSNLKRDADNAKLAGGSNTDPLLVGGWGLGYGFDDKTQIEFLPAYSLGIHERSGLSNGVSNTNGMRSLKVVLRMGFGARSLRR